MIIIGIVEIIYPIINSTGFIGLTPSLIKSDVVLSLATKIDTNIVIKDKIFKGTLQANEIQKGSLTISFIGNEVPKGEVKLNISLKYDFIQK